MKIKRIIAREWLIFLICAFIGIASYILDDYLVWRKNLYRMKIASIEELDRMKELSTKKLLTREEYLELKELRKMYELYNFTGIPKKKKTLFRLNELDKIEQARQAGYSDKKIDFQPDFQPITPEKYKLSEGYSEKGYLLFIPYFLSLFIRSIVWSVKQLRKESG